MGLGPRYGYFVCCELSCSGTNISYYIVYAIRDADHVPTLSHEMIRALVVTLLDCSIRAFFEICRTVEPIRKQTFGKRSDLIIKTCWTSGHLVAVRHPF